MSINEFDNLMLSDLEGAPEEAMPTQTMRPVVDINIPSNNMPQVPVEEFDPFEQTMAMDFKKAEYDQARFIASQRDPAKMEEAFQYADKIKATPDFAYDNLDTIKQEFPKAQYDSFDQMSKRYPALTNLLTDPNFATIAQARIDTLKKIEDQFREKSQVEILAKGLGIGAMKFGQGLTYAPKLVANALSYRKTQLPKTHRLYESELAGNRLYHDNSALMQLNYLFKRGAESLQEDLKFELSEDVLGNLSQGNFKKAARSLVLQTAVNAPNSLAAIGAVVTGAPIAGLAGIGALSGGLKYQELLDNPDFKDVDQATLMANSLLSGVVEGGTETLGALLPFSHALKPVASTVGKQFGKEAAKALTKETFKILGVAATSGALEEFSAALGEMTVDYATIDPKAFDDAFYKLGEQTLVGAFSGAAMTGPMAAVNAKIRAQSMLDAQVNYNFWTAMGEMAETNEIKTKVPELHKKYIETVAKENNLEYTYIDPTGFVELYQKKGKDPVEAATELGIGKEYSEAIETGTDIKIKTADIASKLTTKEEFTELAEHVKHNPNETTWAQEKKIEQQAAQVDERLKADLQELQSKAEEELTQFDREAMQISEQVQAMATKQGKIDSKQAKSVADIYGAFFRRLALDDKEGRTPLQLFQKYGPNRIVKADSPEALAQGEMGLMQRAPVQSVPTFFYKSQQLINEKMGNTATVEQVNGVLKEIKPEERKWLGIDNFLKGKTKVSKQELLDYLKANELQIEEVVKSGKDMEVLHEEMAATNRALEEAARARNAARDFLTEAIHRKTKNTDETLNTVKLIKQNSTDAGFVKDIAKAYDAVEEAKNYAEALNKENDLENKKEELQSDREKSSTPRYSDPKFNLVGGENYREVLFRLPEQFAPDLKRTPNDIAQEMFGKKYYDLSPEELDKYAERAALSKMPDTYKSSHWDETNVLAHTRLNDRIDADGKRVLFIEEIQSDWHQAGRKSGYSGEGAFFDEKANEAKREELAKEFNELMRKEFPYPEKLPEDYKILKKKSRRNGVDFYFYEVRHVEANPQDVASAEGMTEEEAVHQFYDQAYAGQKQRPRIGTRMTIESMRKNGFSDRAIQLKEEYDRVWAERQNRKRIVPDAPFKNDAWLEFVLKRLIREAAEKGYDKIAWTTGEQQIERYVGSVKTLSWVSYNEKTQTLESETRSGQKITEQVSKEKLPNYIGKEIAKIAIENPNKKITGEEMGTAIRAGGEHLRLQYDTKITSFLKKFGKKYSAKVDSVSIAGGKWEVFDKKNNERVTWDFDSEKEALSVIKRNFNNDPDLIARPQTDQKSETVHSLTITPELRDAALNQGFALFQKDADEIIGRFRVGKDGISIETFKNANRSTFLHESAHHLMFILNQMEKEGALSKEQQEIKDAIWDHLGAKKGQALTEDQEELWARNWEAYMRRGEAPSSMLQKAFDYFKRWLEFIYKSLTDLNVSPSPEIYDLMDRLLATEAEIAKYKAKETTSPIAEQLPPKLREKYEQIKLEAEEEKRKYMNKVLMKSLMAKSESIYQEQRKAIEDELFKQLQTQQIHKTLTEIIANSDMFLDGVDFDPELLSAIPEDLKNKIFKKGGLPSQVVANQLGYPTNRDFQDALAQAIYEQGAGLKQAVDAQMNKLYPDNLYELEDLAIEAIHNDSQTKLLQIEHEYLLNQAGLANELERRMIQRGKLTEALKERARAVVDEVTYKDNSPNLYDRAERKAARDTASKFVRGDIEGALLSKEKEILAHEMYKEATRSRRLIDDKVKKFKQNYKKSDKDLAKSRDLDYVNA